MDKSCDCKLIILGDSAVGKSKLVARYLVDKYEEVTSSTHALTLYKKTIEVDSNNYKLVIWDTAGQESFNSLHPSYYFGADVCILVFDATRKITYTNLAKWYQELRTHCPHIPCILVANKIDVDERTTQRQYNFAKKAGLDFYFVSAASGVNVVKIFKEAIKKGVEYRKNPPDKFMSQVLELLKDDTLFDDFDKEDKKDEKKEDAKK